MSIILKIRNSLCKNAILLEEDYMKNQKPKRKVILEKLSGKSVILKLLQLAQNKRKNRITIIKKLNLYKNIL